MQPRAIVWQVDGVVGRTFCSILIAEGLAEPFKCWATSCPRRKDWCRS